MLRLALLALLVLLVPVAAAQETLASLEEPHRGTDKVWEVQVTEEEAGKARALVFRNPPGSPFGVAVYDARGEEIFVRNGTRGVQTLPALEPGAYRFLVRGNGEFQVTDKAWEVYLKGDVSTTLEGTDAYVLSPSKPYRVTFEGNVTIEWWDLTQRAETIAPTDARDAIVGGAYVITVRGEEGAPYAIRLGAGSGTPAQQEETPAAPWLALVGIAVAAAAMARRR